MRSKAAARFFAANRRSQRRRPIENEAELLREELAKRDRQIENLKRRERGTMQERREVEDILAEGLGYCHDDTYGWVIGDHTPVTLAMEARRRLQGAA